MVVWNVLSVCNTGIIFYFHATKIGDNFTGLTVSELVYEEKIFFHGFTALVGLGHLSVEVQISHSDTPHPAGLIWTSGKPIAETSILTEHNILKTQISISLAGFQSTISVSERPQSHASDRAVTGIGSRKILGSNFFFEISESKESRESIIWQTVEWIHLAQDRNH
jgi:hypothetical protein